MLVVLNFKLGNRKILGKIISLLGPPNPSRSNAQIYNITQMNQIRTQQQLLNIINKQCIKTYYL